MKIFLVAIFIFMAVPFEGHCIETDCHSETEQSETTTMDCHHATCCHSVVIETEKPEIFEISFTTEYYSISPTIHKDPHIAVKHRPPITHS